ncbi:MAG: ABC transporter permease [Bacteroidales bacterium]|nr:ABC transporter permease [Bacteroidales bacterium]
MKKILLIIRREYLTRVKKRSFIVMTILGPLLMAAIVIVPIYLATTTNETKQVAVIDETGLFFEKFKNSDNIQFHYLNTDIHSAKEAFGKSKDYALLYIPAADVALPTNAILYAGTQVNINVKSYIRNVMSKRIEDLKLEAQLADLTKGNSSPIQLDDLLRSIKTSVDISTIKIGVDGQEEKSYTEVSMVLAIFGAILIYFFIFMFGSQVMRGVIEEKTSRIVEVIVSSVKPFQLMMGKIIGVAMVGLTQFALWVVLTFIIITGVTTAFIGNTLPQGNATQLIGQSTGGFDPGKVINMPSDQQPAGETNEVFAALNSIDFPVMIGSFLFFFLFGYLMYAALFAAIGGAVDSEADTQQFILPLTAPLILAIIVAQFIVQDPGGPMAFWLSIIPFTSPVVMMIRIPFGVPILEVILSMTLLLLGFLATTWMASKIYRTGILMYGKKVSYKELWKWLRH